MDLRGVSAASSLVVGTVLHVARVIHPLQQSSHHRQDPPTLALPPPDHVTFRIHELNQEALFACALPYHSTNEFVRLVQVWSPCIVNVW